MSVKQFANPAKVEAHRPVFGKEPYVCETCHMCIGSRPEADPVHDMAGPCGCGTTLPAFTYACPTCEAQRAATRERHRRARLAGYTNTVEADDGSVPDKKRGKPGPVDEEAKARRNEAIKYLREYTGTFEFLLDMRRKLDGPSKYEMRLSDGQVNAVLKCKAKDEERAKAAAERRTTGIDLNVLPEGSTHYAVENADGELTFIRVDRVTEGKWDGWVFVKQVIGGNTDPRTFPRLGSQRPGDAYQGSFGSLLRKVLEDPLEAARRFGLELGICSDCGRTLTNAESREYGIGPVCRGKWSAA